MERTKIKREFSAGGVVYKRNGSETLWLVIKPSGSDKWRFPKGWIREGESSKEAAKREVTEEAGIEAEVLEKIGTEQYFFVLKGERIFKIVAFFLMEYREEAKTPVCWETEKVDWLTFEEARERLSFKKEREMLEKGKEMLGEVA
ncbi:MAG: NUDIX domain-containing protein [bacterium]|nr:NUDIX domain-containing protein [bacterium]